MRLRKGPETVMRSLGGTARGIPAPSGEMSMDKQTMMLGGGVEGTPEPSEVECHVWYDLDGNECAWSRVGSGVISIEVGEPDKDAPVEVYQALKDAQRRAKSAEERIAELEEMVARLAAKMAE